MTFSLEEDVNYGSTTDTTTTHSHSRGRGDEGDLQDEDDEDEMDNIRRKQGTPRVNLQRATSGDELLLPLDGEGSIDHASYSETEEQEVADYSEVSFGLFTPRRWLEPGRKLTTVGGCGGSQVVHQTTMDSGSYPSTPKRGSTARPPTRQQLFSLTTARLQVISTLLSPRPRNGDQSSLANYECHSATGSAPQAADARPARDRTALCGVGHRAHSPVPQAAPAPHLHRAGAVPHRGGGTPYTTVLPLHIA